jgi:predicted alpha/beta-fold hydrolase
VEEKILSEESPIAFLIHTMGGSSRESCTNFMATFLMKKKYRVIICSCRGCNGSKITSKRLYNGYQTDDLKFIIDYINAKYPKAKNKFLIGFSLGSMVACQYAVDFDDLDGVVCISHTIRPYQGTQFLETGWKRKVYYSVMINHFKHVALKSSSYSEEE